MGSEKRFLPLNSSVVTNKRYCVGQLDERHEAAINIVILRMPYGHFVYMIPQAFLIILIMAVVASLTPFPNMYINS